MIATYMNYHWMKEYMSKFDCYADKTFLSTIESEYKYKIYTNVQSYIYSCYVKDFLRFLVKCPHDLGLFKPRMLAHYLRNKIKI